MQRKLFTKNLNFKKFAAHRSTRLTSKTPSRSDVIGWILTYWMKLQFFFTSYTFTNGEIRLERCWMPTRCRSRMRPSYFRVATKEKRKEPRTIASSAHSSWSYLSSALSASALSHDQRNRTLLDTRSCNKSIYYPVF